MKTPALILLIFLIAACNTTPKSKEVLSATKPKIVDTLTGDSSKVNISTILADTVFVTKAEIARILKFYPELSDTNYNYNPYTSYAMRGLNSTEKQLDDDKKIDFNSEVGQDDYFLFYAYFLSLKNGREKHQGQRDTLIKIYEGINSIMQNLGNGGTFFGHQQRRILGYAEYSIYTGINNDYYTKEYNIAKQKSLYISSLKQLINDDLSTNFDISEKRKPTLLKELLKTVNDIDGLISNYFYLNNAREFEYSNY
jgi:hypothetical protein